jgi:hypothetical protein
MNRWYFWVLAPMMLATGLSLLFIAEPPTWQCRVVLYLVCGTLLLAILGLARPRRFRWALRAVAGAILLGYMGYAASEGFAWWRGKPFGFGMRRAESNLFNALWGLVVFGLPSLYFLLRGQSGSSIDALLDVGDKSNGPLVEERAVEQGDEADKA